MATTDRRLMAAGLLAAAAVGALLAPDTASACAVCFGGEDTEWPSAFNMGIASLLGLPFAIVGLGVFRIYKATQKQNELRAAEEAAAAADPSLG